MNMKKKLIAIALVAMMGLTACGKTESSSKSKKDRSEKTTSEEVTTEEETTEEETTEEVTTEEETTEPETEEETTEPESEEATEKKSSSSKPADGIGEKYADLDNRSFEYDGKVYTVGVSTFQDLIDGGVPFKEDDLSNADNNVNKNHSAGWYTVDISHYSHLQFEFSNFTDSNIKERECVLSYARWYTIYTPLSNFDEDRNKDIIEDLEKAEDVVSFAFPITLKKDELLANSPDPTEQNDEWNKVEYKIDSTVFYGDSGYEFQFEKDNDQLRDVYITWLP